jgi:hypothetical protein
MTFWQVVVMTIISEAIVFSVFKDQEPSVIFKKWATIAIYLVMFTLSETGIMASLGVKMYSYADWTFTAIMCSIGSDGLKTIIAKLMEVNNAKDKADGTT